MGLLAAGVFLGVLFFLPAGGNDASTAGAEANKVL